MISNVQILRAFAAINVAFYHVLITASSYGQRAVNLEVLKGWGANGVDIFFVISGFVMLYTQMQKRRTPMEFLETRLIRIVPIYWLVTGAVVVLYLVLPTLFRELQLTPSAVGASLLFLSQMLLGHHPIVFSGWTLEWEMAFYVVFAFSLKFKSWAQAVWFVVISLLLLAIFFRQPIVIEFLYGLFVAFLFVKVKPFLHLGNILLGVGVFLLLMSLGVDIQNIALTRAVVWGIPSFLIVLGAVFAYQVRHPILSYLGEASYSIYLLQVFSIPAFYKFSSRILTTAHGDFIAILCLIVSVLAGCTLHHFVERPVTNVLRRSLSARKERLTG